MAVDDTELDAILKQSYALGVEGLSAERKHLLRNALSKFPESPDLHLQLGAVILDENPKEAKAILGRCVELAPGDPWKLTWCGEMMLHLGDVDRAKEYARRASEQVDDSFEGWPTLCHLLGKVAAKKLSFQDAERLLRMAFEADPETPGFGRELADLYYQNSRFKEALETVDDALKYRPSDDGLRSLHSEILAQLGIGEED